MNLLNVTNITVLMSSNEGKSSNTGIILLSIYITLWFFIGIAYIIQMCCINNKQKEYTTPLL